jgi:PPOX class probable F420-dependent enzyme
MFDLPNDVRELVDGPNYAHLATSMPNGSPHSVPLWVGIEGDHVVFLTGPQSRKAQNIAGDPRVAISLLDHANPYVMGTIRGRVVDRLDGDAAWTIIDRLAQQYLGQPYPRGEERVVFVIEPEHASVTRFG